MPPTEIVLAGAAWRMGTRIAALLREAADEGRPVLEAAPDTEVAAAIRGLAEQVQARRAGGIRKALTVL